MLKNIFGIYLNKQSHVYIYRPLSYLCLFLEQMSNDFQRILKSQFLEKDLPCSF